jgi:hypothetical protein
MNVCTHLQAEGCAMRIALQLLLPKLHPARSTPHMATSRHLTPLQYTPFTSPLPPASLPFLHLCLLALPPPFSPTTPQSSPTLACTHVQMLASMFCPLKQASARYCPMAVAADASFVTLLEELQTCNKTPSSNTNSLSVRLAMHRGLVQSAVLPHCHAPPLRCSSTNRLATHCTTLQA